MSINILMPALSPTMTEGKLAKWHVKEGDTVKSGQVICEIETDKATMEVEAVDEGKIGRIVVRRRRRGREGECRHRRPAGGGRDGSSQGRGGARRGSCGRKARSRLQRLPPHRLRPRPRPRLRPLRRLSPPRRRAAARIFASPLAKRIAADKGLDLSRIKGSGPERPHRQSRRRIRQAGCRTRCGSSRRAGASRGAAGRRAAGVRGAGRHARAAHRRSARSSRGACSSPSRRCRTST